MSSQWSAIGRHAAGLILVVQPLPGMIVTLSVAVLALVAAHSSHATVDTGTALRLVIAVQCTQVTIGAINDYCDRQQDMLTDRLKPIARGWIAPWEALALAFSATIVMFLAVAPLGIIPTTLVTLAEGLGLAYDLRLKGTILSGFMYALAFPLSPLLAWAVFGRWQPFLPWLVPLGALLGVAANVANSLPDLEADRAAGIRGLPHVLGLRAGLAVAWGVPLALLVICWALDLTGAVPAHALPLLLASAFGIASVLLAALRYRRRPTTDTLRLNFIIQGLGMVGLAAGWLAAVAF